MMTTEQRLQEISAKLADPADREFLKMLTIGEKERALYAAANAGSVVLPTALATSVFLGPGWAGVIATALIQRGYRCEPVRYKGRTYKLYVREGHECVYPKMAVRSLLGDTLPAATPE